MITEKPKLSFRLRTWQQECLFDQISKINKGSKNYFLGAGVGSGKTLASLATFMVTDFDIMIVVTPKSGIRGSWHKDAAKVGLKFETLEKSIASIGGEDDDTDGLVKRHDEFTQDADFDMDGTMVDRSTTTGEMINELREELKKSREKIVVNIGRYTLSARAVIDGAVFNDELISEEKYLQLRNKLAGIINPLTAMRASGKALLEMTSLFEEAHG